MTKSQKPSARKPVDDKSIGADEKTLARYKPVPKMLEDLLARIDPEGYAILLEEFREEYQPVDWEVRIVAYIAQMAHHMRGCLYLETEVLNTSMAARISPDETNEDALARAYISDFSGPNLLAKIQRYHDRLQREFSRGVRILRGHAASRRMAEERAAQSLLRRKTCTSVIQ